MVMNLITSDPDCVLGPCRHGRRYTPSLVRVGLKVHHSVASVALDTLVEKRLQASATVRANEPKSRATGSFS